MNYEQKYKEALERAKKLKETCDSTAVIGWCEYIFPELKESEDEKIRKRLIGYFQQYKSDGIEQYANGLKVDNIIAWLEKQAKQSSNIIWHDVNEEPEEQREIFCKWGGCGVWHEVVFYHADTKTFWSLGQIIIKNVIKWTYVDEMPEKQGETFTKKDVDDAYLKGISDCKHEIDKQNKAVKEEKIDNANKIRPKFDIGDWIIHYLSDGRKVIRQIINITNKSYVLDGEHFNTFYFNDIENDYHLWTIQDANEGDVLVASDGSIFIYKSQRDNGVIHYIAVTPYNDLVINKNDYSWENKNVCHPATKDEQTILFERMKEAGYEWDAMKKQLKKL